MAKQQWDDDELRAYTADQVVNLYRAARKQAGDHHADVLAAQIVRLELLTDERGGLPHDHPDMLEIEEVCGEQESVEGALAAVDAGLPPLAGMEHRIVKRLGERYGPHGTTNHAGRRIAIEMEAKGLYNTHRQMPMPNGSVAQSATVFQRKGPK